MVENPQSNSVVTVKDPKTHQEVTYSMNNRLRDNLTHKIIPSLNIHDKDCVIAIDGREGAGKSTLALQIGKYVDPSLDLTRVVFDPESFRQAVFAAKKGQCVIYDEAFTGFSSRASLSPVNRVLVSLMMQMRQKNLFVIIVLPTFYLLDRYVALFRTRALIHVFESKGQRGYFKLYNAKLKQMLYLNGKKTMSYSPKFVRTNFKGRFYGKFALGDKTVEEKYRAKKEKALSESEKTVMSSAQAKYKEQRDIVLWRLRKETKMTYQELQSYLEDFNFVMNYSQVRNICVKFGDKDEEEGKKKALSKKNKEKYAKSKENSQIITESEENQG